MTLTRDYKETILARIEREPEFAKALLAEFVREFFAEKLTDTQLTISVNLNGHVRFDILDDEQVSRYIKAVLAGEPIPWDMTAAFIAQLDKALAAAKNSQPV